jgi:hypothetical protein
MASQCPHCSAVVSEKEIQDGWCESCGKALSRSMMSQGKGTAGRSETASGRSGSLMSCFTLLFSVVTFFIAVAALLLALFREANGPIYRFNFNAFHGDLGGYDFSSAAESYKSQMRVGYNQDDRVMAEFHKRLQPPEVKEKLKEKLDTLEIKREAGIELKQEKRGSGDKKAEEKREIKILFATYKDDGETRYEVVEMERHPKSGLWIITFVEPAVLQAKDKDLVKDMDDWMKKNDAGGSKGSRVEPPG